ncbi:MAG: ABC transporter ATP-binding protein [Anaerolineae bacterium]|nr:ABC transporter ATP-binding protein [Anaerolineae bacterium]
MGFILDGLDTETYDRNYSDRELLARIVAYFKPYAGQMSVVGVTLALNSIASSAGPIIIAKAIGIMGQDPSAQNALLLAGAVLVWGVLAWVFNLVRQWFSARVIGDVVLKLREDVFEATIGLDLSFYDEHPTGKIVSRVTSDTQDFSTVADLSMSLFSQVLLVVVLTIYLMTISVPLTLLLVVMTPFVVAMALSFRRIARRVTQNARRVTATINAQIQESVSGIVVAKSFRQERAIYDTFNENNRLGFKTGIQRGLTLNTIFPLVGGSQGIGIAILVFAGALASQDGLITPDEWYLFMLSVGFYWWPMVNISSFWSQFQDGLSAAERAFALIDAEPKVIQEGSEPVDALGGRIEFRDLCLTYTGDEVVLPSFSLAIQPGETVALVGHTGAGKSSLARMVTRFYEFQAGEILIDGRDIRSFDLQSYRRHVGLVPQVPFLFSGSVMENIRYGRPDATDDEVCSAAQRISEGEWLAALPDGLDTDVGERGANLSMGQRQLVALARVLLKNPPIFILDEATASVDPFTETQIQDGLEMIMRDRTAIIIAHRLSTVKHADRIIVMDHGEIIEEGTHDGLMVQGGHYAELYNTYFRHQSLEYVESFGGQP